MTARDRIVILVVLALAAVVGSWLLVIQPKRAQASQLGTKVAAEQSQLTSAETQVQQGESARGQFSSNYTQLVRLGEAVPADDDVPSLIYQLQGAANAAHVDFRTLQVSSSGGSAPATTPSTPASSSSTAAAAAATLPPGVAVGPAGFPAEQFSFSLQGSFFHLASFFNRIQKFVVAGKNQISISGRLMTINGINLSAGPKGFPQITANVSATTYLVQASQGLLAGATATGPAGAGTSTTVGTSSSTSTPTAPAAVTPVLR